MKVEMLFFDGCPNYLAARELVERVLAEESVAADVESIRITDQAGAEERRFIGSPTVRVDGLDVEPAARDVTDYGFTCRVYRVGDKDTHVPSADMVREAVKAAGKRT